MSGTPAIVRPPAKVVAQEPEWVSVGGESLPVRPLVIRRAREFRQEIARLLHQAQDIWEAEKTGSIQPVIDGVQTFFDVTLIDLVKIAIPELRSKPLEWIEESCTEAEFQHALGVALQVNFPWLKKMMDLGQLAQIGTMMTTTKATSQ